MATETIAEKKQHSSSVKRIWKVFWILSVITTIEVVLGIEHPDFLKSVSLWNMELLNWIFIALTVVKAYYIVWAFMHMEKETANFRRVIAWGISFYIAYILFIFLSEGSYIHDVIHNGYVLWNF